MEFTATEDQVRQIFCNAVNASSPVGMGHLHFEAKDYEPKDIEIEDNTIQADYYEGRMVKLSISKVVGLLGETQSAWKITRPNYPPNPEYQSWAGRYHTLEELVNSVLIP